MASSVPQARKTSSPLLSDWKTGEHGVPVVRYTSRDFAALEAERFWSRVWQMACRIDQIPNPGDFTVYDILKESILVVRADESTVRAYHNVCPHRATALAVGAGHFQLEEITCPFHGWKWNLKGENIFIACQNEFKGGCLSNQEVHLKEVNARVWAGFVYISLAKEPLPFEQFVAPIAQLVEGVKLGDMRFHYHYLARVNCNWKVAQEAFMESYHVPQTHPQLTPGTAEEFTSTYHYQPMQYGHGLFHSSGAGAMGRISQEKLRTMTQEQQTDVLVRGLELLFVGQDAQAHFEEVDLARTMRHRKIPEGMTVGQYFQVIVREHYAHLGRPIGSFDVLKTINDMHVFPHVIFLPSYGNAVMYRVRPAPDNDPDWCLFDMYAIRTYGEGQKAPPWKTIIPEGKLEEAKTWFKIPSQDFTSIVRQQRGMHSTGIRSTLLSHRQESLIANVQREIDTYLESSDGY